MPTRRSSRSTASNSAPPRPDHQNHHLNVSRFTRNYSVDPLINHGKKSKVYEYFGDVQAEEGFDPPSQWEGRNVCSPCINEQILICNVTTLKKGIGTTNLSSHLWVYHKIKTIQKSINQLSLSNPTRFSLDLLISFCLDLKPFNSVNNRGFQMLIDRIRPDIKLCSNSHLSQNVLPAVYIHFKNYLKQYLAKHLQFGTMMFDI